MKLLIAYLICFSSFAQMLIEKPLTEEILESIPSWDKKTQSRVQEFAPLLIEVSNTFKVDNKMVLAVAWAESHFNPEAVSSVGALGIMQVKPNTQEYILDKTDSQKMRILYTRLISKNIPSSIVGNLIAGTLYLRYLLKKYDGDQKKAIIAYNMGPTGTSRLIKNNQDLNNHSYLIKIQKNMLAMN